MKYMKPLNLFKELMNNATVKKPASICKEYVSLHCLYVVALVDQLKKIGKLPCSKYTYWHDTIILHAKNNEQKKPDLDQIKFGQRWRRIGTLLEKNLPNKQ
ncbi:hypothetical protein ACOSQ3_027320 [Xanthoceras sorbifolium]